MHFKVGADLDRAATNWPQRHAIDLVTVFGQCGAMNGDRMVSLTSRTSANRHGKRSFTERTVRVKAKDLI